MGCQICKQSPEEIAQKKRNKEWRKEFEKRQQEEYNNGYINQIHHFGGNNNGFGLKNVIGTGMMLDGAIHHNPSQMMMGMMLR